MKLTKDQWEVVVKIALGILFAIGCIYLHYAQ